MSAHESRGADGESIRVEEFGEPDGKPVLVHHGSPGSRRLFRLDAELAAREFGLRLLSYDRPGYGSRSRRRGRRVADATDDGESQVVVFSLWRDNLCVGTFRLGADEVPDLIASLRDGLDQAYDAARKRVERVDHLPRPAS